jgi:hypothetical protein
MVRRNLDDLAFQDVASRRLGPKAFNFDSVSNLWWIGSLHEEKILTRCSAGQAQIVRFVVWRSPTSVLMFSLFVRWLRFSNALELVKFASLTRSEALRKRVDDLISLCGEMNRYGKIDLKYSASDIAEINRKLDVLLSAKFPDGLASVEAGGRVEPLLLQ